MKIESGCFLNKAHTFLPKARDTKYPDEAGRAAYLAAFHAAQAYIFELKDKVVKTHKGVHNLFYLLSIEEPRFDDELRRFLPQVYEMEAIADYESGPSATVPWDKAISSIATAERFVALIANLIETK